MITYYELGGAAGALASIGVDDQDSTVKHVRVDLTNTARGAELTLYDVPNNVVFHRVFGELGSIVNVALDESEWVPYSTEIMTLPGSTEELVMMTEPLFMFSCVCH